MFEYLEYDHLHDGMQFGLVFHHRMVSFLPAFQKLQFQLHKYHYVNQQLLFALAQGRDMKRSRAQRLIQLSWSDPLMCF